MTDLVDAAAKPSWRYQVAWACHVVAGRVCKPPALVQEGGRWLSACNRGCFLVRQQLARSYEGLKPMEAWGRERLDTSERLAQSLALTSSRI